MKNLKLILGICLVAVAVFFTSCGKEEVTTEDTNQLEASVENEFMDWETLMNTPSTLINPRDLEIEVIENVTGERTTCCTLYKPEELMGGTNRFRTTVYQQSGYYLRYRVLHNGNSIGDFEYAWNFPNECQTHDNIIDIDNWCSPPIMTGENYVLAAYLYDKYNSNGCFAFRKRFFTGD